MIRKQIDIKKFNKRLGRYLRFPAPSQAPITDDFICPRWEWIKYITFYSLLSKIRNELNFLIKKFIKKSTHKIFFSAEQWTKKIPKDRKNYPLTYKRLWR